MGGKSSGQLYEAFGAYVRSQRQLAQLTLRQAAELASISNPYLSQIEHGVALPSISVIGALADALSVSAETLLLQAAGIDSPSMPAPSAQTETAIRQDARLDDGQKRALLAVVAAFVRASPPPLQSSPSQPARATSARTARATRATKQSTSRRPAAAAATTRRKEK
jgi:transcriptional regulator with XRE-family HTH domain